MKLVVGLVIVMFSTVLSAKEISVTSWNIWLTPKIIKGKLTTERSPKIAEYLKEKNTDVIGFQEFFLPKRIKIISEALKEQYPYTTGYPIKGSMPKKLYNSGLAIMSKYPIVDSSFLVFQHCPGLVCLSTKGVLLAKIDLGDGDFLYVANTHLKQSADSTAARRIQMQEMMEFLNENVPEDANLVMMGDFNVNALEVENYEYMLNALGVSDYTITSTLKNSAGLHNYWRLFKGHEKPKHLDHIFFKGPNFGMAPNLEIDNPKGDFGKHQDADLSDHYPIHSYNVIN